MPAPTTARKYNRLINEKSPYLLQHAENPVDWFPWSDEAFEKARAEDKPVFLSIGYATCHWCHVMEHESFENQQVADLLNNHYVPIKLDREERPDIDHVYMQVTQAMTGSGGWPMSVFMTHDKKPFFAGTYFPRETRGNHPGFIDVLTEIASIWQHDRPKALGVADQVGQTLQDAFKPQPSEDTLNESVLDLATVHLERLFDPLNGGFSAAPKFPAPHTLTFLLRMVRRNKQDDILNMVETTLDNMRQGGIYDHIGYGLHRYSTDRQWLLPHFEKMLYDQALYLLANVEAWQITRKDRYKQTAHEVATYVLWDLTSPEGGFYCAEDADSEGVEGKFYLWTPEQIREVLGNEDAETFCTIYNIEQGGNFKDQATGEKTGESIPHLKRPLEDIAEEMNIPTEDLALRIDNWRELLFTARQSRIRPLLDDKILTEWNGLMIAALAAAGRAFDEPTYIQAAQRAATFVLVNLKTADGRLLRRYRQGDAALPAILEDYTCFTWGLIELYNATYNLRWLREAINLTDEMITHFGDKSGDDAAGGFYMTADDSEKLLIRTKEIYDGATPSGNSVAALNLLRLARLTGNTNYEQQADNLFKTFAAQVRQTAPGHTQLLSALEFQLGSPREIVIVGDPTDPDTEEMLRIVRDQCHPNDAVLFKPTGPAGQELAGLVPFTKSLETKGAATAWICHNFSCQSPMTNPNDLRKTLSP